MKFDEIDPEVLRKIWAERKESTFLISSEILNFSDSDENYSTPKENPPSAAFIAEDFVTIIYYTSDDLKGRWIRFVLYVYATGGKILYKKESDKLFSAQVVWNK